MPSDPDLNSLRQELEALREEAARLHQEREREGATSGKRREDAASETGASPASTQTQYRTPAQRIRRAASFALQRPYYLLAALIVFTGLAFGGYRVWRYLESYESAADAEITGYISPISSKVEGTVARVLVENDQIVKAGQTLVE
jgi:dienelactone hydrolase